MRRAPFAALTLAVVFAACAGDVAGPESPPPGTNPPTQPPPDPPPPTGTPNFSNPCQILTSLFTNLGPRASRFRTFTLSSPRQVVMRYASDFRARFAILPPDQVDRFANGDSYQAYGSWDGGAGTDPDITLSAGQYTLGIFNVESVAQDVSAEVDFALTELPPEAGFRFPHAGVVASAAERIQAGGRAWQPITIQAGFRYVIDGTNTRVETWMIPEDQLSAFQAGGGFQFYRDYHIENSPGPGCWELRLPPGRHYLAMRSTDPQVDGLITYLARAYAIVPPT